MCRYRGDFPVFSDDIQGIAAVVIAGMLAAQPLTGKSLSQHTFLFAGEGRGATATAEVCCRPQSALAGPAHLLADHSQMIPWSLAVLSLGLEGACRTSRCAQQPLHEKLGKL